MLVNIWATIIHLSDANFAGAYNQDQPDLDLLIVENLKKIINHHEQTWMINPVWRSPGTTAVLLRDSYVELRDTKESYLVLVTPGFADVLNGVSVDVVSRNLEELARRAKVFNKRLVTTLLGIPPKTPKEVVQKIKNINQVTKIITHRYGGVVTDLTKREFTVWDEKGSRPKDIKQVAKDITEGIMQSHPELKSWERLHKKS